MAMHLRHMDNHFHKYEINFIREKRLLYFTCINKTQTSKIKIYYF